MAWCSHHNSWLISAVLAVFIWPSFIWRNRVVNRTYSLLIFDLLEVWNASWCVSWFEDLGGDHVPFAQNIWTTWHPEIFPRNEWLSQLTARYEWKDGLTVAFPASSEGRRVAWDPINFVSCFFLDEEGILSEGLWVQFWLQIHNELLSRFDIFLWKYAHQFEVPSKWVVGNFRVTTVLLYCLQDGGSLLRLWRYAFLGRTVRLLLL